jgi:hypothetical protein
MKGATQVYGHKRLVIRTDGTIEPIDKPITSFTEIEKMLGCSTTGSVTLRAGLVEVPGPASAGMAAVPLREVFVMIVDDLGYETNGTIDHGMQETPFGMAHATEVVAGKARKPVNALATALYHANCRPGTTHQIVGDVYVAPDSDWARSDGF